MGDVAARTSHQELQLVNVRAEAIVERAKPGVERMEDVRLPLVHE
jgi:hypothetical protein